MQCKILFSIYFATSVLLSIHAEIDVSEVWNTQAIPLGRYYSLTRCLFKDQGGYTCIGCNTALHCYPTNGAIQVECRGLFRYCRKGFCSLSQGEKCFTADKVTESPSTPVISDSDITTKKPLTIEDKPTSSPLPSQGNKDQVDNILGRVIKKNDYGIDITETSLSHESVPLSNGNNLCKCS